MKKNTLLIGALALLGMNSAFAQDLVIETMKGNENIELVTDAIFDRNTDSADRHHQIQFGFSAD